MNLHRLKMQAEPRGNVLELWLYSEIVPDGETFFGERVRSDTSANAIREMLRDHPECSEIRMYINSAGGSVYEGYAIYAQLKRFEGAITCYVDGFANSIASIIAMAAGHIVMYANSVMTIHNMADCCFGNAAALRKCADDLDKLMEGNRQIYLARSGGKLTEDKLVALLEAETVLTAQECLDYGFCDEILTQPAPERRGPEQFTPPPSQHIPAKPVDADTFMACFRAEFDH